MAQNELPHQDLGYLKIQLFWSLVLKVLMAKESNCHGPSDRQLKSRVTDFQTTNRMYFNSQDIKIKILGVSAEMSDENIADPAISSVSSLLFHLHLLMHFYIVTPNCSIFRKLYGT